MTHSVMDQLNRNEEQAAAETAYLERTYEVNLEVAKGRTVDVRIVPYGETALVDDGFGGAPAGVAYREQFMPGVFSHQVNAANRVLANVEHERGIGGIVGRGLALREASDGFHGSFKLLENPDGDKALMLINEGVFTGISLEARPMKNVRTHEGIVQRVKAHLRGIAFCREGAYSGAQVLAVREATFVDEELLLPDTDPDLVERCRRLGLRLPQRFEAHPEDEPDTPDDPAPPDDDSAPVTPGNHNPEVEA
jgi:HK97 family phage prohead protease